MQNSSLRWRGTGRNLAGLCGVAIGILAASCAKGEGTPQSKLHGGGETIVRITFARSGGVVAAPGMTVEGSLAIDGSAGHVTVQGDEYQRDLTAAEVAQLARNVDVAKLSQLPADLRSHSSASADQYQYDITIEAASGTRHSVTVGGNHTPKELDDIAPGLGALFEWIRRETEAIWQARISRR